MLPQPSTTTEPLSGPRNFPSRHKYFGGGEGRGKVRAGEPVGGKHIPSRAALRSSLVKFNLVDSPNRSFDVLDAHETFVKGEVVADGILNRTIHKTVSNKQMKEKEKINKKNEETTQKMDY